MFERLLEPGCTESPACQCGGEMNIAAIETLPQGSDAAVQSTAAMSVNARCDLQSGRRLLCRQMAAFSPKLELTPTELPFMARMRGPCTIPAERLLPTPLNR